MPKLHLRLAAPVALATLLCAVTAGATPIVLDAIDSGWYDEDGAHDQSSENYLVGNRAVEHRNFFVFDLTSVAGQTFVGAELRLENPVNGFESPDGSETYGVFQVTTPVLTLVAGGPSSPAGQLTFADLGSGTSYGSASISEADEGTLVTVVLNASALGDLQAAPGLFAFGGAITSLGGATVEDAFRFTGSSSTRQLVLFPVPEPSSFSLLALGTAVLGAARRGRRR